MAPKKDTKREPRNAGPGEHADRMRTAGYMSAEDVARAAGISKSTVHKLIASGEVEVVRENGHVFVARADVENRYPIAMRVFAEQRKTPAGGSK